jgi:hypothetical protein
MSTDTTVMAGERQALHLLAPGQLHFEPFAGHERRTPIAHRRHRDADVEREPGDADDQRADEEQRLRPQDGGEDLPKAHLAEPEPVGVVADDLRHGERQQQQRRQSGNPTESRHGSTLAALQRRDYERPA